MNLPTTQNKKKPHRVLLRRTSFTGASGFIYILALAINNGNLQIKSFVAWLCWIAYNP